MVVILCPPPLSSLSLMLPLLFYCCYRRSDWNSNQEIRTASVPDMLFTCGAQCIP